MENNVIQFETRTEGKKVFVEIQYTNTTMHRKKVIFEIDATKKLTSTDHTNFALIDSIRECIKILIDDNE